MGWTDEQRQRHVPRVVNNWRCLKPLPHRRARSRLAKERASRPGRLGDRSPNAGRHA
ncbi:MAG: hypothetical protein HYV63_30075 [Candidatus Schekmanbacteria bacterium]|nr:hypothetical protein [Candidatus Schekmanbacteria bacterium]